MSHPDLFEAPAEPILDGLKLHLDRESDRRNTCHANLVFIHEGKGPHAAELRCVQCGRHRGWLKKETADLLTRVVRMFGAPAEPLVVRDTTSNKEPAK